MPARAWRGFGWLVGLAVAAAPAAAQQPATPDPAKVDFRKLRFMAGCWEGPLDRETTVEEIWTEPAENLLLATTRYLKKNRATSYEFTRIHVTDTAVVYSASTEGKPFDSYVLKTLVDEYVVFENLSKTFPQRIIYRLASDGALIPRNEGDGQPSLEVRFRKKKCPGA
jgi:hypothetical protein